MAVDPVDIPIPDAEEIEKREGLFVFMTERVAIDSRLNKNQRRIRDAVAAKRIEWVEVRVKDTEIEVEERIIPQ